MKIARGDGTHNMVTLFSCPKPFTGQTNIIQRNAIKSWQLLHPKPEIILLGNEPGSEEACKEFGITHIKEVERNENGTPLVSFLFKKAQGAASSDILCYINADIMLADNFTGAIKLIKEWKKDRFLMIGRRHDLEVKDEVDFNEPGWIERIKSQIKKNGHLHACTGMDYFIFKRGMYQHIPPFVVGRPCWDGWFVYQARQSKVPVIDASGKILAIHQDHPYRNSLIDKNGDWNWEDEEIGRNLELSNRLIRDISNSTHRIKNNRISRRTPYLLIEPGLFLIKGIVKKIRTR